MKRSSKKRSSKRIEKQQQERNSVMIKEATHEVTRNDYGLVRTH